MRMMAFVIARLLARHTCAQPMKKAPLAEVSPSMIGAGSPPSDSR